MKYIWKLESCVFERQTISNYEEDREKQFGNDQDSVEDIIDNDTISVAIPEKSEILAFAGKNLAVKEATNKRTKFPNKNWS